MEEKNEQSKENVVEIKGQETVKKEKIKFWKKLWWSSAKVTKYDEMMKEGVKRALKYFAALLCILAVILAIGGTYIQMQSINGVKQYLESELPEFNLEQQGEENSYELSLDENEAIILDDSKIIELFNCVIVINADIEEQDAINEYYDIIENKNNCIIFTKDEVIAISTAYSLESENQEEGIAKYTYKEFIDGLPIQTVNGETENLKYDKQSVISYFENTSYIYYLIAYFADYFIILAIIFVIDALIIALVSYVALRILRIKLTFRKTFIMAIHTLTLPSILYVIYLLVSYFTNVSIPYVSMLYIAIACIYASIYINIKRVKEGGENVFNRRNKKQS